MTLYFETTYSYFVVSSLKVDFLFTPAFHIKYSFAENVI